MPGTFDQLNDALFAQLDKLQSIDPNDTETMEQAIEQSRAVSSLASNIIGNANMALRTVTYMEEMYGRSGKTILKPKLLTGGE